MFRLKVEPGEFIKFESPQLDLKCNPGNGNGIQGTSQHPIHVLLYIITVVDSIQSDWSCRNWNNNK